MQSLEHILSPDAVLDEAGRRISRTVLCSPFCQRLLTRYPQFIEEVEGFIELPWSEEAMREWLAQQRVEDEVSLKAALRLLRQRVMLRTIGRDLNGLADMQEVVQTVSALAEVTLQFALQYLQPWLEAQYGKPLGEGGLPQELIVIGMGKLGGRELNVSSDIDLIFAFEEEGDTTGDKSISNGEFFSRLGKKLISAIDDVTEDGFVFRVDMRLRPYGSEGPLACSLDFLEEYYQNQGREWERYAWIKGRVVAGPGKKLTKLLLPFVFRKYLDYGAFASMRDLKVQIQRDVNRRDMHDNIKLGRGGIREIEFIAQVFQLIRGGRDTAFQVKATLDVLQLLAARDLLPASTVHELTEAYVFLRNLEHRLQYVEDAQTQELPKSAEGQARIATSMHFANWDVLRNTLEQHRSRVELHFSEVFSDGDAERREQQNPDLKNVQDVWQGLLPEEASLNRLQEAGYQDLPQTLLRLNAMHSGSRYKSLPELSRQRLDALMPTIIHLAGQEANPEVVLVRALDLLESICRRASYLAMLAEYPAALGLVIKLLAASPWLAQYLTQHPILLDELLDTRRLYAEPDFSALREDLQQRLAEAEGDVERQMDVMRHFKHAAVFRFAAQDIAGQLPLQRLSDYLSALANLILQETIDTIWPTLRGKHRDRPKFAIIGYGKLGGMELAYASDLDIIFLYDDDAPEARDIYARFGQRINTWLNSLTSAGLLYETDLQLRPNGASGLLVSSVAAFADYQHHQAWVWEHQALTRARYSAGDVQIGEAFERIRVEVIAKPRDLDRLRNEVIEMRQKMRDSHPPKPNVFDLKHDKGGIIDVEFIVQYLVLAHACKNNELTQNLGNIQLLGILGNLGIFDRHDAEAAAEAYREFRTRYHACGLQGETHARVPLEEVLPLTEAVSRLWQKVFGE